MESTSLFYQTLLQVLGCHQNWLDVRHLKTLSWMVNGLIQSGKISLGEWVVYVHSRAQYAASTLRRFHRFLDNDRIEVHPLYASLLVQALQGWQQQTVYVALDTSMLWNTYYVATKKAEYLGIAFGTRLMFSEPVECLRLRSNTKAGIGFGPFGYRNHNTRPAGSTPSS